MKQDAQDQLHAERIEALIQKVGMFSDIHARETTEELLQCLLDMYGAGLTRILELTMHAEEAGFPLVRAFVRDELIGSLLLIHDLHPVDLETRVVNALEEVRPYLKTHGGGVELVKVEQGVVYLRLDGSCHGCPSSTITLKQLIEEALYKAAPDLERLEVEGVAGQVGVAKSTNPVGITCGAPVTFVPPRRRREDAQLTAPGKGLKDGR